MSEEKSGPPPITIKGLYRILPYLYLGDANSATKIEELRNQNIKHIINLSNEEVDDCYPEEIKYHSYDIPDDQNYKISEHFGEFYDIIAEIRDGDIGNILVHDERGQSQSVAVILAYMLRSAYLKRKTLSLKKAYEFVQAKKIDIQPNDGFMRQLIRVEKDLFNDVSIRISSRAGGKGTGPKSRKKKK